MFTLDPLLAAKQVISLSRAKKATPLDYDDPISDMVRETIIEGLPLWLEQTTGFLYLAANAGFPGVYKLGCTRKSVAQRMRSLNGEGMPTAWVPIETWQVYDAHGLEALAHKACSGHRIKGELFKGPSEHISSLVNDVINQDLLLLDQGLNAVLGGPIYPFSSWSQTCAAL